MSTLKNVAGVESDPRPTGFGEKEFRPSYLGLYGKFPSSYWYYDTPDGEDCMQKMWFCMKTGAILGGIGSIYDVLMFTKPVGYANVAFRIGYGWLFSSMATGAAYSAGVCTANDLRQKDDKLNHLIGGMIAGPIFGAARGCFWQGLIMTGVLSSVGMFIKDCRENKRDIFPDTKIKEQGFWQYNNEFDLTLVGQNKLDDRRSDASYKITKWGVTP